MAGNCAGNILPTLELLGYFCRNWEENYTRHDKTSNTGRLPKSPPPHLRNLHHRAGKSRPSHQHKFAGNLLAHRVAHRRVRAGRQRQSRIWNGVAQQAFQRPQNEAWQGIQPTKSEQHADVLPPISRGCLISQFLKRVAKYDFTQRLNDPTNPNHCLAMLRLCVRYSATSFSN